MINFGWYLIGENFFNFSQTDMVETNITEISPQKLQQYEHETLLDILIIVTILTLLLCLLGLYVEFSKLLNKPNQDETEEWVSKQLLNAQEYVINAKS